MQECWFAGGFGFKLAFIFPYDELDFCYSGTWANIGALSGSDGPGRCHLDNGPGLLPETARRLGLVTRAQMLRALLRAVEDPTPGVTVVDVPGIRAA